MKRLWCLLWYRGHDDEHLMMWFFRCRRCGRFLNDD